MEFSHFGKTKRKALFDKSRYHLRDRSLVRSAVHLHHRCVDVLDCDAVVVNHVVQMYLHGIRVANEVAQILLHCVVVHVVELEQAYQLVGVLRHNVSGSLVQDNILQTYHMIQCTVI